MHLQIFITKIFRKIQSCLVRMENAPFQRSIGNVEKLKNNLKGLYSLELNKKDRLVYHVDSESVRIIFCEGHYDNLRKTKTKALLRKSSF